MKINGLDYDTEIRPLLAEFMGYTRRKVSNVETYEFGWSWYLPSGEPIATLYNEEGCPVDPLRSHSDCHALIEALNQKGYNVEVNYCAQHPANATFRATIYVKRVSRSITDKWFGDYYREGVVTLAVPIAREAIASDESSQNWSETLGQVPHEP